LKLPIVVVPGRAPLLLGRNWLRHLTLDWKKFGQINKLRVDEQKTLGQKESELTPLDKLLNANAEVFKKNLGTMADIEVHIELKEGAKPKFCRARPLPYSTKPKVDVALDEAIEQGIWKSVPHSDWAAPIVPVAKEDGSIRICGDYKLTVNKAAENHIYPVPKTEDLLATLNGGQKFTKLDLSQAYQQLKLDSESQKLCTINTHRGLFQPTRLQFGIHAAAGIFQREMEKRLAGIPCVIVRVDDILVTGANDAEHLDNLAKVLEVLKINGLRLKKSKCFFMME